MNLCSLKWVTTRLPKQTECFKDKMKGRFEKNPKLLLENVEVTSIEILPSNLYSLLKTSFLSML